MAPATTSTFGGPPGKMVTIRDAGASARDRDACCATLSPSVIAISCQGGGAATDGCTTSGTDTGPGTVGASGAVSASLDGLFPPVLVPPTTGLKLSTGALGQRWRDLARSTASSPRCLASRTSPTAWMKTPRWAPDAWLAPQITEATSDARTPTMNRTLLPPTKSSAVSRIATSSR